MMIEPRLIILQPTPYCNISCSYCYLSHRDDRRLMSPDVLQAVCDKIIGRLPRTCAPAIVWHAGEPTVAPIAWYEDAYDRLRPVAPPGTSFAMQSNGIAIDERWIDFFQKTGTHISLSIDGPQRFHDERRRTRNGKPTWALAMRGLKRLQQAGLSPKVITVLHPAGLDSPDDYFRFYLDNDITDVSFSIDEREAANISSSFAGSDYKPAISAFIAEVMRLAFVEGFPLRVREVERISQLLIGRGTQANELVEAWASIVVAADGSVSTFSPEFMEVQASAYDNFVFGNVLSDELEDFAANAAFQRSAAEVAAGVTACRDSCRYFHVCGGGSPVNKFCELGSLSATETEFCRLSTQAAADALFIFLKHSRNLPATSAFLSSARVI
jgi:uncharacterized protein